MAVVFVTGANRGIGLALTYALADRGDTVLATARVPDKAPDLKRMAALPDKHIEIFTLDVTDPASIAAVKAQLGNRPIDILINNAGVIGPERQSLADMDYDGWLKTFEVNTLGPFRVLQALIDNLQAAGNAYVMTITSRMGSFTASRGSDRLAYRASKAAINKVMQSVAADLAALNIAVAVAHPGWVQTGVGGRNADISAEQSAAGLIHVIDRMSITRSPRFVNYDGSNITW
ncbi:MAG: SDR family oxidoreductase [Ancalomicrobiaceae bacterium]|nr:SDR family oxidoreductase [Ancalomicrobiaceae bacterium]